MKKLLLAASALAVMGLLSEAQAVPATGVAAGTSLFSFDTTTPGSLSALQTITGLQVGETVLGIDYRPATSVLYGLGSTGRLYTISAMTGAATLASTLSTPLTGTDYDIGFNPTVDRLRVVGSNRQDLRVNVDTGVVTVDGTITYAAGDANAASIPQVTAVAYTNQLRGAVAATTLFDIDGGNATFTTQAPPNNGTLNTVGRTQAGLISFDIDGLTNSAFAASGSAFYALNTTTGGATLLGAFGRSDVSDFAITEVPEPVSLGLLSLGLVGLAAARRRAA